MKKIKEIISLSALVAITFMGDMLFAEDIIPGQEKNLTWTVPRLTTPPKIDGKIGTAEWAPAAAITGFVGLGEDHFASSQPVGFLGFDSKSLYVALRVPCPRGASLVPSIKYSAAEIWNDESVELFISSKNGGYRHLIVNDKNKRYDVASDKTDIILNGHWSSATGRESDYWTLEIAFPWEDLGWISPPLPSSLQFNICWNRMTGTKGNYTWSPVKGNYNEPNKFATLNLSNESSALRLTRLSLAPDQSLHSEYELVGDTQEPISERLLSSEGKVVGVSQSKNGKGDLAIPLPKEGDSAKPGLYILEYKCGRLAQGRLGIKISSPISIKKRMLAGFLDVSVDLSLMGTEVKPAKVEIALISDITKRPVMQIGLDVPRENQLTHTFDMKSLPVGQYTLRAIISDKSKKTLSTYDTPIQKPSTSEWQEFRGGISDEILLPWTPITISETNHVQVWGREYQMANGFLPESITTQNKDILSEPIMFKGTINEKPFNWKVESTKMLTHRPDFASFEGSLISQGIRIRGISRIEYDGMIKVDVEVIPTIENPRVNLVLEVPLKQQYAKYLYWFPGVWGKSSNAGVLPSGGWHSAFKPYVALSDEDCGLAWFCESMEGWRPSDPNRALTIVHSDDSVVLKLDILSNASLTRPVHYTFGFEAAPVKPNTPDVWDYRIMHLAEYGPDKNTTFAKSANVAWLGKGNIELEKGTFECWIRLDFDPSKIIKDKTGQPENQRLFFLNSGPKQGVGIYWEAANKKMIASIYDESGTPVKIASVENKWKKGEWHHVAVSWDKEFTLWIDGQKAGSREYDGLPRSSIDQVNMGLIYGKFAVDEIRISNIARIPQTMDVPFDHDSNTLLLEHFNDVKRSFTSEDNIAPEFGLIPGKFGKALLLHIPGDPSLVEYWAALGVRTLVIHQGWTNIQSFHKPSDPQALHDLVSACHKNNIKLLLYFGTHMSEIHPVWDIYKTECLQVNHDQHDVPNQQMAYNRRWPDQLCWNVCAGSLRSNYVAWTVAGLMEEYDIDGVYLDGTAYPLPCGNEFHGCGYVGDDGKRHDIYPIFATRNLVKRLYTLVKTRKPEGQVNIHNSTMMVLPTVGWGTSLWDGESIVNSSRTYFENVLPLDTFRAEYMGRQWGLPTEFLAYPSSGAYTTREALAFTLIHDVIVRPLYYSCGNPYLESKLWHVMDAFGRKQAAWLPYWNNSQYVQVTPDGVKVSIYNRKEKGALFVISNLGKTEQVVTVIPDTKRLGLGAGPFSATDMMSEQAIDIPASGKIGMKLKSMEWRLINLGNKK